MKDQGICLDKLEKGIPDFYDHLISSGWMCITNDYIKSNHKLMVEFYANSLEINFG